MLALEDLACRRRRKTIKSAELVACENAALRVDAEIYPRALFDPGHRVDQLHAEIFRRFDSANRRRLIFPDGRADRRGSGRFASFTGFTCLGRLCGGGQRGAGDEENEGASSADDKR